MIGENPGHQPHRFQVFKELSNGKGFTIRNTNHIFYFDQYGGWFDQYGNYYDGNGIPSVCPTISKSNNFIDNVQDDDYDKIYGTRDYQSSQDEQQSDEEAEPQYGRSTMSLFKNLASLQTYPLNQLIRLHFLNLSINLTSEQIMSYFKKYQIKGIMNIIVNKDDFGRNKGQGCIIAENAKTVKQLLKLQGELLNGKEIHFSLDSFEVAVLYPLSSEQLNFIKKSQLVKQTKKEQVQQRKQQKIDKTYQQNNNKKYVRIDNINTDNKTNTKQKKVTQFQEQNQRKKTKEIKQNKSIKKQNISEKKIQWIQCEVNVIMFPLRDDFGIWMSDRGFKYEKDYKNIIKLIKNEKQVRIKLELKKEVYSFLKGSSHNGKKVMFQKCKL